MEHIIISIPEKETLLKTALIEVLKRMKLAYTVEKKDFDKDYLKSIEQAREDYKKGVYHEIPDDAFEGLD